MSVHYLYNFTLLLVFIGSKKALIKIVILTYPFFLLFLPETGYDFGFYERAFETIYFSPDAPLFFRSASVLTAEPGWFFYNGIFSFITSDFRIFLVLNFFLCMFVLLEAFNVLELKDQDKAVMVLSLVPVIFPTLFFWSPRSSISFVLAVYSLALCFKSRYVRSGISGIASVLIHSQYLPVLGLVNAAFASVNLRIMRRNKFVVIPLIVVGMLMMYINVESLVSLLSFLPSSATIEQKTSHLYFHEERFRLTSILSVFLLPAGIFVFLKKIRDDGMLPFVSALAAFGAVVNIIFFQNAHVAGRLSRVSDYFLFSYLIAVSFSVFANTKYLIYFLILMFYPLLFQDLYPREDVLWMFH